MGRGTDLLYNPHPIRKAPPKLPFFLEKISTTPLPSPTQQVLAGEKPQVIDKDGRLLELGEDGLRTIPLTAMAKAHKAGDHLVAFVDPSFDAERLGALLYSRGDQYLLPLPAHFASVDRSLSDFELQAKEEGFLIFDKATGVLRSYKKRGLDEEWKEREHTLIHFIPGDRGAFAVETKPYEETAPRPSRLDKISLLYLDSEGRSYHSSWRDRSIIDAKDFRQVETDDGLLFFSCKLKNFQDPSKATPLYCMDLRSDKDHKTHKVAHLKDVPKQIISLGKSIFILYQDNSYQVREGETILLEEELNLEGDVFLSDNHLLALEDEGKASLYRIKKEESVKAGLSLRS